MKKFIISEQQKKIIADKLYSVKRLEEQKNLKSFFSNTFDDIFKYFSDDAVKSFDNFLYIKFKSPNVITQKGKSYLISQNIETAPIPMEIVEEVLLNVAKGRLRREEVLKYFPSKLADGTEFRSVMDDFLKNKKPLNGSYIPKNPTALSRQIKNKFAIKGCTQESCPSFNSIKSNFISRLPKSNTKFSPQNVKVVEGPYHDPLGREVIVVKMPNGEEIIWNSSSGVNAATTGKEKGTWSVIPGFGEDGWFIKDWDLIDLSRGKNQYLTDMAKFLEKNGSTRLGDAAFEF
jgi:hypothetical protein